MKLQKSKNHVLLHKNFGPKLHTNSYQIHLFDGHKTFDFIIHGSKRRSKTTYVFIKARKKFKHVRRQHKTNNVCKIQVQFRNNLLSLFGFIKKISCD